MSGFLQLAVVALSLLALSACDTAEDRANKHYQSAIKLLETGDVQRALVEFRNVFALDSSHKDARLSYAKATRSIGNISESYSSYLAVAERFPNDMETRLALTEMAILVQNWDEAERHSDAILASAEGAEGQEIAMLALEFRKAVIDKDAPRMRELTRDAENLAADQPDNEILHRILIEGYLSENELNKAMEVTNRAIEKAPDIPGFYRVKAMLLARRKDVDGLEEHLRATISRFPNNTETKRMLIQLLAREGRVDSAEEFLRSEISNSEEKQAAHVTLISFIRQSKGSEAALVEIENALAAYEDGRVFDALKSGVMFELGRPDEAVAILQSVVDGSEANEESEGYRVTLAKMLVATENDVGARQLVESVLANNPSQIGALKMSANWLIESDQSDAAIKALRQALDQSPDDAESMTLMARAHERNGDTQLAQDLLALAVDASGNAPAESLRFAGLMISQERYTTAENTLISALRIMPGNLALLKMLGQVYLATEDWSRAGGVEATLRRQETEVAKLAANSLQLQIISRREGNDQGLAFLKGLAAIGNDSGSAKIALIRVHIAGDRLEAAVALAEELAAEFPDETRAKLVLGNTQIAAGDYAAAEATLALIAKDGENPRAALQYSRVLGAQGKADKARIAVEKALEKSPGNIDLLWSKASFLERDLDIDGAIAIYETLYAKNSSSRIVANNLASLLATYRDDDASLERAYLVARRLRGTESAPFQDTYGWILYRRGDFEDALTYLVPAAEALGRDPIVQFHLAQAFQALGRDDEAIAKYHTTIEIAGSDDPRPQIETAKAELSKLSGE